ncbi:hypothetical protein [Burkholderia vietnamiensis]|uniref:hypothetical protein n=1 Tax=Burkholderia vietnamiensis TaxID=60552 RepID=UPI001B8F005B|nr:hypothetical protein [Burkholderia vietnamiensis]MBR8055647.1 hypothetical protein [Burkholderia vietnamiensis]
MPTMNAQRSNAKRVPIPLNAEEIDKLQRLAKQDQRSEAQMARIIYLAGLKQFPLNTKRGSR